MTAPERVPALLQELGRYLEVQEVQVIDFSLRARYGPWLKVRVEDDGLLEGLKPGQRFHMILIAIGDDDMPATANPQDRKPYKLSQLAGMMCSQADFWQWITEAYDTPCSNKDEAADWLRSVCNVESRSLFDTDDVAGETFRKLMAEYDQWKQAR
mgnify:CR=1 FL=1